MLRNMSKQYRTTRILFLASLVLLVATACKSPSTSESDSESPSEITETSDGVSNPTVQPGDESSAGKGEGDTDVSAPDVPSPEETGVADLEKIVDEIAPKDSEETRSDASDPASAPADAATQEAALALATDGLQVITVQTGSIRAIPFEVEGDRTIQIVTQILGKPTETIEASECPAGPITVTTWPNGLTINTMDQTFIGWNVRPTSASQELTTVTGVGIGTTVSDLKATYDIEVFESSLGAEFKVGQLSGLLSADQPDGVVTNLWSGINCIFR